MVAFHFPPLAASSGIQRALSLVKYLPQYGWEPLVLTAKPFAYERTSPDLLPEIPASTLVQRAFALDTARHLTLFGRYLASMARPDRWVSWYWSAVLAGIRLIRKVRPAAIWSTYPIATAHLIGAKLHQWTGLPWIADFRDPMAQEGYPEDKKTWRAFKRIEEQAAAAAARLVFTTASACQTYMRRYPQVAPEKFVVIENGYDEDAFARVERKLAARTPLQPGRLTLLHSGIVYPSERDPTVLFQVLARLRTRGVITPATFCLRFRAPVHENLLWSLARQTGTTDLMEVLPPLPYDEALAEMMRADGLLVLQASNCNEQIPAKFYEYLRARRPIIGLTDPDGDTGRAMREAQVTHIAKLEDADAVEGTLLDFLSALSADRLALPPEKVVRQAARSLRVGVLARMLDELTAGETP